MLEFMKQTIKRVKGTQDIIDTSLFDFLIGKISEHLKNYNFSRIITPILEPLELFKRTLGTQTDVVSKEMYTVEPSSDKDKICLRPEATASIMRAFLENNITNLPWKVFSYGPIFRHERPQKGRYREFYQISMEVIGSESICQDSHFIKMLDRFFSEKLFLNNYALLINFLGCAEDREIFKQHLHAFLLTLNDEICKTCIERQEKNILRVFDCKNTFCLAAYTKAPKILDHLCSECQNEWSVLRQELEHLSISYSVSNTLVRGLDYYAKTVFEFVSLTELGAQNTFCGGGRYNTLATELGSKEDFPSIGAAIGVERTLMLLENKRDVLKLEPTKPLYVVIPLSQEQQSLALLIADELQAHEIRTDVILEKGSIKSLMRRADKLKARFVLLIGPEEQENRTVSLKDMQTGQEQKVKHTQLLDLACSLLLNNN